MTLRSLLEDVAAGKLAAAEAESQVADLMVADLGHATLDLQRHTRRGRPEAVFCEGKTPDQVLRIIESMLVAQQNILLTRLKDDTRQAVLEAHGPRITRRSDLARIISIESQPAPRKPGEVAIVTAGTSDLPVSEEAAITAETLGSNVVRITDVGVAGLHRLLRHSETLRRARVVVVVAGMDGALPSVVAGLVQAPVIAVPTSVGYGASFHGVAALLSMLNACAPGIGVVNIDNGYGAGYLADAILGSGKCEL